MLHGHASLFRKATPEIAEIFPHYLKGLSDKASCYSNLCPWQLRARQLGAAWTEISAPVPHQAPGLWERHLPGHPKQQREDPAHSLRRHGKPMPPYELGYLL